MATLLTASVTGTPSHTVLTIIFKIAVGCPRLGWIRLPGGRPWQRLMWWREAKLPRSSPGATSSRMPAYLGARTILPVENPAPTKPYSGSDRPLATMPAAINGEFTRPMNLVEMPHICPVGPEPILRWRAGVNRQPDQLLTAFLPTACLSVCVRLVPRRTPSLFAGRCRTVVTMASPQRCESFSRLHVAEITERGWSCWSTTASLWHCKPPAKAGLTPQRCSSPTSQTATSRCRRERHSRITFGMVTEGYDSVSYHPERQPASAPQGTPP